MANFSFKTEKPTGRYRSFFRDNYLIKLSKIECGSIVCLEDGSFRIRLMVRKEDAKNSSNPNCDWQWISLKKPFNSVDDAKSFIKNNSTAIQEKFDIYLREE